MWGKGWGSSGTSSYRGTKPTTGAPPSPPNLLPKAPSPDTITLGFEFHHINLGGAQTCSPLQILVSKTINDCVTTVSLCNTRTKPISLHITTLTLLTIISIGTSLPPSLLSSLYSIVTLMRTSLTDLVKITVSPLHPSSYCTSLISLSQ